MIVRFGSRRMTSVSASPSVVTTAVLLGVVPPRCRSVNGQRPVPRWGLYFIRSEPICVRAGRNGTPIWPASSARLMPKWEYSTNSGSLPICFARISAAERSSWIIQPVSTLSSEPVPMSSATVSVRTEISVRRSIRWRMISWMAAVGSACWAPERKIVSPGLTWAATASRRGVTLLLGTARGRGLDGRRLTGSGRFLPGSFGGGRRRRRGFRPRLGTGAVHRLEHPREASGGAQLVDPHGVAAEHEVEVVLGDVQPPQLLQAPAPDVDLVPRDAVVQVLPRVDRRLPPRLRVQRQAGAPVRAPDQLGGTDVRVDQGLVVEVRPPAAGLQGEVLVAGGGGAGGRRRGNGRYERGRRP